ncbi:MAG: FAD:protein FMN transferase [Succinivibrionaceae bacterium]
MKNIFSLILKSILFSNVVFSLSACNFDIAPKDDVKVGGKTMGTFYNITVVGDYPGGADKLRYDADSVLNSIVNDISLYDKNTPLSKFNAMRSTDKFVINENIADVVLTSIRLGKLTGNYSDITISPLVNLWGFGAKRTNSKPSEEQIENAKSNLGQDKIYIEYNSNIVTMRKDNPNIEIDLATVGEGYGADKLADLMDEKGIQNYMVSVAGAIRTKGVNSRGTDWVVALESPSNDVNVGRNVEINVCTKGNAISTSGSYRNYQEDEKGNRISHIIDPKTGAPIKHNTVSVTVIGKTALYTDALDTGFMVMGYEKALVYANEHNIPIYAIEKTEDGYKAHYSRAMQQYLDCE